MPDAPALVPLATGPLLRRAAPALADERRR